MRHLSRSVIVFSLLLNIGGPGWTSTGGEGVAGQFLNEGVGGRPIGMGKAFTGVADDVDSLYWNPGGLGTFRASQVTLQQTNLIGGAALQYLGVAEPMYTFGCLGAGVVNLTAGNVDRTDDNFIKTGTYNNRETGYLLSYGQRFGDHWGVGGTAKMAENVIDSKKARGYGGDVGALYAFNDALRFGAMVRNLIIPKYKFDTDTESFSRFGRVGASYKFLGDRIMLAMDVEKGMGGPTQSTKIYSGIEGRVADNIALRAGINSSNVMAGVGVGWKSFVLDYAAEYQKIGFFHTFSLKIFFGGYEVDVRASPTVFSPVGLKHKTLISISCRNRSRIVKWILSIKNAKGAVVRSFRGYDSPPEAVEWDGSNATGRKVDPGTYYYRLTVTDNRNRTEQSVTRELRIVAPTPIEIESK